MDQIERSLLQSLLASSPDPCGAGCWRPAVDVYRQPDGWLCKFDLAGVAPEDVEVDACGHRMRVAGMRRDRTIGADCEACTISLAPQAGHGACFRIELQRNALARANGNP